MRLLTLLCALVTIGSISACGVKPNNLEKPDGKEHVVYPRTYPAPETD
jgi:predicted small lipoprotein YifL